MAAKKNFIVRKTKNLSCGHQQTFSTPVPQEGDCLFCSSCQKEAKIPYRKRKQTVAEGRPRRLKSNPRANNQYTKGRKLNG